MPDNRKPLMYGAFPVCRNYTVRAHIRDLIAEKRRGCANTFRNAGTFQRRVHPQHLRPLDTGDETERSGRDWKHHPKCNLTPKSKRRLQVAAAVKIFGKRLKNSIFVLFCQINLDKSTAFTPQCSCSLRRRFSRKVAIQNRQSRVTLLTRIA